MWLGTMNTIKQTRSVPILDTQIRISSHSFHKLSVSPRQERISRKCRQQAAIMKVDTRKSNIPKAKKAASKSTSGGGGVSADGKILNAANAISIRLGIDQVPRKQVAALCGIKYNSSTFANGLTKLKKRGSIQFTSEHIIVTEQGRESADPIDSAGIPTTNEEYHELIKEQYKLKGKALDMFDFLSDGREQPTKAVAEAIGCKLNSTFANLKTNMKKLGIITFTKETIKLTDEMFQFGRPEEE